MSDDSKKNGFLYLEKAFAFLGVSKSDQKRVNDILYNYKDQKLRKATPEETRQVEKKFKTFGGGRNTNDVFETR